MSANISRYSWNESIDFLYVAINANARSDIQKVVSRMFELAFKEVSEKDLVIAGSMYRAIDRKREYLAPDQLFILNQLAIKVGKEKYNAVEADLFGMPARPTVNYSQPRPNGFGSSTPRNSY